ncbi:MAG: hypothetical protein ACM3U1_05790 [Chloroflexota bacterium]
MRFFLILFVCAALAGCFSVEYELLRQPAPTRISYYNGSEERYADGSMKKCRLKDTASIGLYKCVGWIHFFPNGDVDNFETAAPVKYSRYEIPPNSRIFFYDNAHDKIKTVWFPEDIKLDGIECQGGEKISVDFYENGSLKACFLSRNQTIQGFPCKSSLFSPVYFYPDGRIMRLTLCSDAISGANSFAKGETLVVTESGVPSVYKK